MASYDWWQRALAGEKIGGPTLPIHDGDRHCGFFRKRKEARGSFVGVAIFEYGGDIIALVDKWPMDAAEAFSWGARHPVSEEAYRQWDATGKWPDEDSAVAESLAPPPATIGDNNPPTDDAEILRSQIEAASKNASDYVEINDDLTAAKAQGVRSRLLELRGDADKKREALVRPHLDAQNSLNAVWMPLVKDAKAAADAIAKALGAHETRKDNARKKALADAEGARIKAEREAAKAAAKGKPEPPPPPPPPEPEPIQTQVRGSYGRAATIKAVKTAKVTDRAAFVPFVMTHKEFVELTDKLAQRAVDAGLSPPGVTVTEEKKVV